MGFDIADFTLEGGFSNRRNRRQNTLVSTFQRLLFNEFLDWGVYSSALIIDAAAEAINCTIVVWVAHPTDETALTVLRAHSTHGRHLAIHAPRHAKGVIRLRFYNTGDELDSNVWEWGSGFSGHFQLLHEPINYATGRVKESTVLLLCGDPARQNEVLRGHHLHQELPIDKEDVPMG